MLGWRYCGEVGERNLALYFPLVHLLCESENCLRFMIEEIHLGSKT